MDHHEQWGNKFYHKINARNAADISNSMIKKVVPLFNEVMHYKDTLITKWYMENKVSSGPRCLQ